MFLANNTYGLILIVVGSAFPAREGLATRKLFSKKSEVNG